MLRYEGTGRIFNPAGSVWFRMLPAAPVARMKPSGRAFGAPKAKLRAIGDWSLPIAGDLRT
jgi:hypothetical protein